MYKKLLLVVLLLFSKFVTAQVQMKLTGEMPAYKGESFMLLQGDEGGVFVIDSSRVNSLGILEFVWSGAPGFYRISNNKSNLDFKIDKSLFKFSLSGRIGGGELQFSENDENYEYQYYLSEFMLLNKSILELREYFLDGSKKDSVYREKYAEFKKLKKEKRNLLKDLWESHIDSWSARFALAQQELVPGIKLTGQKANEYYLKHFFDYFAFSDSLLIGTPVYYEKIGRYLKLQDIDNLISRQDYRKIKEVINNLFWLTELKPESQKYLANYLMNRYPEEEYKQVFNIVIDAYRVLNTCEYVLNTRTIKNRISISRTIEKGWRAPDVPLYHSTNGRVQSLSDVNSELTLVVMWSGSCEHSKNMLSEIAGLYYLYKDFGLEVVAISLDNNLNYWKQTIFINNYPWINACDTDGLTGKVAEQLSIYVTPSMFLIDSSLKTVAVPQTFFQLEKELNEIFR